MLANHDEVQKHEDSNEPGQDEGVQAVEASERCLTNAFATAHELDDSAANNRNCTGNARYNLHSPVANLIPREGVARYTKGNGDNSQDNARHPSELTRLFKAARKINAEDVQNHYEHHHAGRPAVDGANEPTKVDVRHQVLNRGKGVCYRWPVVEGHCESSCELDDEANECDTAKAVENIDVGRNVLAGDIVSERLNL